MLWLANLQIRTVNGQPGFLCEDWEEDGLRNGFDYWIEGSLIALQTAFARFDLGVAGATPCRILIKPA
jgi:hypothetical protein